MNWNQVQEISGVILGNPVRKNNTEKNNDDDDDHSNGGTGSEYLLFARHGDVIFLNAPVSLPVRTGVSQPGYMFTAEEEERAKKLSNWPKVIQL